MGHESSAQQDFQWLINPSTSRYSPDSYLVIRIDSTGIYVAIHEDWGGLEDE